MPALWETNRDAKLAQREAALEAGRGLLKQHSALLEGVNAADVLSVGAGDLAEKLYKTQNWTAKSILLVYIQQSLRAQAANNLLTEVMYTHAWERASALDAEYTKTKKLKGRLHGVPISIKDHIDVQGYDTTIGFTYKNGIPAEEDSYLVNALIEAGGNPFIKTNIPQTMLSFECSNPLFGISTNPYDSTRTPGGSSGGEAAILASDASALGIGSDIGGSLRIPAHYSGCYGIKPTIGRSPIKGVCGTNPGFESIAVSCGPMGRSVGDLEVGMRCLVEHSAKYARVEGMVPLPWREYKVPKKLKFGYYTNDGIVRASPACARAVQMSVDALRSKGHECIEIKPVAPLRGLELFVALTSAGNYETLLGSIRDDPKEGFLYLMSSPLKLPRFVRSIAAWAIETFAGDGIFARVVRALGRKSVTETQAWAHERDQFASEVRHQLFGELELDALICPPQATPALRCGETWDISAVAIGTFLYNVVDSTAAVLPVCFVDPSKDGLSDEWKAERQLAPGSKIIEGKLYDGPKAYYNEKEMAGLPVGVQLVAAKYEEEKVIKLAGLLDDALGPRGFGPGEFFKREQQGKK